MKLATLACLAALCLTVPFAHAAPGEAVPAPQKPAASKPEAAKAEPPKAEVPAARSEPRAGAPVVGSRDRRRRSYAACNRASHQRGYRGGKRRRFLIRCRLGYERARHQQQQQAPAAAPAPAPVRKP